MRTLDRIFKLSRIFKLIGLRHTRYSEYSDGVPGWDGYYDFMGRCIAFKATAGDIVYLHEVR